MLAIFLFEVKYYIRNLSETINFIGLFSSVILLAVFAQYAHGFNNQALAVNSLWIALTVGIGSQSASLFQRDHITGRLEYYQLALGNLTGVILAKFFAYYISITIPLLLFLPVVAILVDIPVDSWPQYGLGLISGGMALGILASLVAVLLTGLDRIGAVLSLAFLPMTIPIIIFGTSYLSQSQLIQPSLLFLWGFSAFMLPVLCIAGNSCIRSTR